MALVRDITALSAHARPGMTASSCARSMTRTSTTITMMITTSTYERGAAGVR